MQQNKAADRWAAAQDVAKERAATLAPGDTLAYEEAEVMGEQAFAELRKRVRLEDTGDGYVVRAR
jgi:hypothetical protein